MKAVTPTQTEYHPRGSGPAYGEQFQRLRNAWNRITGYRKSDNQDVNWVFNGDVSVEMWLWVETDKEQSNTVDVVVVDDLSDESAAFGFYGIVTETNDPCLCVFGPGVVKTYDELVKMWWEVLGQYNTHPWDANGIIAARRLGLVRNVCEPEWGCENWGDYHLTDRLSFEAFDNGEYERKAQEEIWNSVNKIGFRWRVN